MAYYLRFLRTQHNATGETVGKIVRRSKSTVSRFESGEYRLGEAECEALDRAWNTGRLFSILLHYARIGHDPNWLQQYKEQEAQACLIKTWQSNLVPGLLQTPDYARAGLRAGGVKDVDAAVEERMARQAILEREDPPTLLVLLAESLLELPCGGPAVMKAQLARILELSERPNIGVRVVPKAAGHHPGLDGPFMLLTLETTDVAYVEAPGGGRLVSSASQVRSFGLRYDRIGQHALPENSSRELITRIMETM
ncbi:helix-turn-helix transcriptional regulator [Actinomadura keratinilytica]|jgi:hypothetical protein|uniref:Helix-turn-helix transcriptional regulator n=1 Tax=Actinomadura keratinilytica TaxID=547461 RepID=A0ABP7Y8C8_9ACTN